MWSYRASGGFTHNAGDYEFLPEYETPREAWVAPGFINLLVGHVGPSVLMHSWGGRIFAVGEGRMSVLAWTSPVDGVVRVAGTVTLPSLATCDPRPFGDPGGITWTIEHGSTPLGSAAIGPGGSFSFALTQAVKDGETIYFVHDPAYNSLCDSAVLRLSITKRL